MEFQRNSKRDVLGELRASSAANFEHSFKNVTSDSKSLFAPVRSSHCEANEFVLAAHKSPSNLSNLELLTKVASRVKHNLQHEENTENILCTVQPKDSSDISCKPRKEKSLSILCDKFLKLYPLNVSPGNFMEISLDQATQFIGTDRRRIYDILIVLECLQMASKVCKNHYQWHGTQHLVGTLSQLKWLALRLDIFHNVNSMLSEDSSATFEECTKDNENSDLNVMDPLTINAQAQSIMSCKSNINQSTKPVLAAIPQESKDKKAEEDPDFDLRDSSLGIMCQKFLMLFLVTSKVITLDNAAKILLRDTEGLAKDCHKVKTKIRRLYDIANVLSSLELIKKVNVSAANSQVIGSFIRVNKKPAFQYIGPQVQPKPLPDDALITLQTTRHSLLGHPSHAVCEKKSTRKRKLKNPCPLLPKLGNILKESSAKSGEPSCGDQRSQLAAFPLVGRNTLGREKFPRSHSENCITETPQHCGSLRSDILKVAELELQRLADEEKREKENSSTKKPITPPASKNSTSSPKCNWKRYHSENCISVSHGSEKGDVGKDCSPKVVSWKSSIIKHSDSKLISSLPKDVKINGNVANNAQWQSCDSLRKDVSIYIINGSSSANKLEGKFKNCQSIVPIAIHSMHKSSRLRSISINPIPISSSNCIVGPAYIIHQLPTDTKDNLNPLLVSMTKSSSDEDFEGITLCNDAVE